MTADTPRRGRRLAQRWAFRLVLAASLVGVVLAYGVPLWYQVHGSRLLIVTGGSMEPNIHMGDAVVIRPLKPQELRPGQVITFQAPGAKHYTTHRIVQIVQQPATSPGGPATFFVQTKGDNNRTADPDLTPVGSVRGIVIRSMPGWGHFLFWAHTAEGRLVLFAPALLLVLGAELMSWRRRPAAAPVDAPRATPLLTPAAAAAPLRAGDLEMPPARQHRPRTRQPLTVGFAGTSDQTLLPQGVGGTGHDGGESGGTSTPA